MLDESDTRAGTGHSASTSRRLSAPWAARLARMSPLRVHDPLHPGDGPLTCDDASIGYVETGVAR